MTVTDGSGDVTPRPDPTSLTTQAAERLEERLRREIEALQTRVEVEFTAMTRLIDERFNSVGVQFGTIQELRQVIRDDDRRAIDAALATAKEAVAKSEQTTKEQLEQMRLNAATIEKSLRTLIESVKEQANKNEQAVGNVRAEKLGGVESRNAIIAVISAVGALLAIAAFFIGRAGP